MNSPSVNKAVAKYLSTYAEQECEALENFPPISVPHILVIPGFRETTEFAQRLTTSAIGTSGALVIVVINQPPGPEEPLNQGLLNFFQRYPCQWQNGNLALFTADAGALHWLVVDRFTSGRTIDSKQGVGLARKLGADLAASLIAAGRCTSSWIYSTDADATLPNDYFSALDSCPTDSVAAVFNVRHLTTNNKERQVNTATELYERALRYYVDGLAWAGSPYAFPTIGSALAVQMHAYCECRGFPRKAGGEDFYLLNKLAKLGHVHWLKNMDISVAARVSDRVPFGTGPAVKNILALSDMANYTYYSPANFADLRIWLHHIPLLWQLMQRGGNPLDSLPTHVQSALDEAGIHTLWTHIRRQVRTPTHCEQAVHHWFDAFQTLKFIRRLQDLRYPALPLAKCLQLAPFYQEPIPCRTS